MRTIRHMVMSIAGVLKHDKINCIIDRETGKKLSDKKARKELQRRLDIGERVISMSDECEGFDPVKGCPTHPTIVLHLTLKKLYFEMIKSGFKKEEYREIKPYWEKRLREKNSIHFKKLHFVQARNGYAKDCPKIEWRHLGTRIGTGHTEWGAVPGKLYFILEIGHVTTL